MERRCVVRRFVSHLRSLCHRRRGGGRRGVVRSPGSAALSTLLDHLSSRPCCLLFDNCEHLLDDVASIVDAVLVRCPGVGVVTTSRTSLGRVDEMVWRLGPLETEGDAVQPAVELFVERAGAVSRCRRRWRPTTLPWPASVDVSTVCRWRSSWRRRASRCSRRPRSTPVSRIGSDSCGVVTGPCRSVSGRSKLSWTGATSCCPRPSRRRCGAWHLRGELRHGDGNGGAGRR